MSTTIAPPPPLADHELVALVVPFDEPIASTNPSAPLRYRWGDLELPRREVPLREEHDGREIGLLSFWVQDRSGLWAAVKAGHTATAMIDRGVTAISAEINGRKITGAALVPIGMAAFASARLYGGIDLQEPQEPLRFGLDTSTGTIAFRPPAATSPATVLHTAMNLGRHRRELTALSMAGVDAEVSDRQRRFTERREELAQQDIAAEESALREAGVPTSRWPSHLPGRQRWEAYQQQLAAARAREVESARMYQLEVEASADRRALGWWQRQRAIARARAVEARRLEQLAIEASADRRGLPWWRRTLRRWFR